MKTGSSYANEECQCITIGESIEKQKELVRLTTKAASMKKQLDLAIISIEEALKLPLRKVPAR